MHKIPSALARAAIAPVALMLVVAGCSGSQKGLSHTIQSVATATRAAGSGSARGTASGTVSGAGSTSGPMQSVWVAQKDATATDHGQVTFAMFACKQRLGTVEMRWIGDTVWVGRAVRPTSSCTLPGFQSLLLRASTDRQFLPTSMTYLSVVAAAFSPARLAAWLAGVPTNVRTRPGNIIGSNTTEYYTVQPFKVMGPWTHVSVSLWADSKDRVVRARLTSPDGGADYTVTGYTSQPDIVPPPPGQTVTPTTQPPPTAAGAYALAASGKSGNVTWSLMRAPGTRGTECWRWNATPTVKILNANADGSRCYVGQQPGDSYADATAVVVQSKAPSAYTALAVRLPAAPTKVTLGFAGGKMQALQPSGKILVWVGPSSPLPAYLGLTFANGTKLDCFAGTLIAVDDLSTTTDAQVADSQWSC